MMELCYLTSALPTRRLWLTPATPHEEKTFNIRYAMYKDIHICTTPSAYSKRTANI